MTTNIALNTTLQEHAAEVQQRGYTILTDGELSNGLAIADIRNAGFTNLQKDIAEVHKDRERSRDAWEFALDGEGGVSFARAAIVAIVDRNYEGSRSYLRADLLEVEGMPQLVAGLIGLIPEGERPAVGRVGLNCFRTHGVVTETVHRDFEDYVAVYCLARNADGAATALCRDKDGSGLVVKKELAPGEILFFADKLFFHYATSLEAIDATPYRDALVITISA